MIKPLFTVTVSSLALLFASASFAASAGREAAEGVLSKFNISAALLYELGDESVTDALGGALSFGLGDEDAWHGDVEVAYRGGPGSVFSLMANGYYGYRLSKKWAVFAGIGLGGLRIQGDDEISVQDEESFAYQGIAGVRFKAADDVLLRVGWRYFDGIRSPIYGRRDLSIGIAIEF